MTIQVSEPVVISAVRYALGRATYIVNWTVNETIRLWPDLSANTRNIIRQDVEDRFALAERDPRLLGMECDRQDWRRLLDHISTFEHPTPDGEEPQHMNPDEESKAETVTTEVVEEPTDPPETTEQQPVASAADVAVNLRAQVSSAVFETCQANPDKTFNEVAGAMGMTASMTLELLKLIEVVARKVDA